MMKRWVVASLAAVAIATPSGAQESSLSAPCDEPEVTLDSPFTADLRTLCLTAAQAVESGQPQLGILLAGGNPTPGTASAGGLRLGLLPRLSANLKLNLVFVELPDILAEQAGGAVEAINDVVGIPAPALSGTVAVGVFPGFSVAPTLGGIGAIDLLGTATWLPFSTFSVEGFGEETPDLSYGIGARVGLLRESFTMPGVSVSLMYRRIDDVQFGNVCDGVQAGAGQPRDGFTLEQGVCPGEGDAGEFAFDLTNWSGRAAVSKSLLGFGVAAGVGYDRFDSDIAFAFRNPEGNQFFRASDLDLTNDRWSAFVNGSFSLLIASLVAEAGWMQGGETIDGLPEASDFDPEEGTFFGSVGIRFAL